MPKGYREMVHQEEPKDDPERRLPLPPNLPSNFQAHPIVRPESMWPVGLGEDREDEDGEQEEPSTEGLSLITAAVILCADSSPWCQDGQNGPS